ncbi:MAG: ribose 5-phosphate isomerase A, partial [Patulibacter sp.]|nr:ribose 5-phosphate isomerase A [Patulibacter sp.]
PARGSAAAGPGRAARRDSGELPAMSTDADKQAAAEFAAQFVEDGQKVGLGTGSTVAPLLPALARRGLTLRCVSTSPATEELAKEVGLSVEPFEAVTTLDIAIDGADQIDPDGWLVKGGGRAHTREKAVEVTAARFIVIADGSKPVERITAPIPLELLAFGHEATIARLGPVEVRPGPLSPDGGVIADWKGEVGDPAELAALFDADPGVISHGLFPPSLVTDIVIADGGEVTHREL